MFGLTCEVRHCGGHPTPLEEGICFRVHHQQTTLIASSFNGRHYLWMCLPLNRYIVHLTEKRQEIITVLSRALVVNCFNSLCSLTSTLFCISQDFSIFSLCLPEVQHRKSCMSTHKRTRSQSELFLFCDLSFTLMYTVLRPNSFLLHYKSGVFVPGPAECSGRKSPWESTWEMSPRLCVCLGYRVEQHI